MEKLVIEYPKANSEQITKEIIEQFDNVDVVEVNSFGMETVIQVLIPLAAIFAPFLSPIILKLLENKKITVKYKGIEYSGNPEGLKNVLELMKEEDDNS